MAFKTFRTTILLKAESTYGTDPTPAAATDGVLFRNAEISFEPILEDRTLVRNYMGGFEKFVLGQTINFSWEVELAGSGALGTAPKWAQAQRMCGFAESVNTGVNVVYTLISTAHESATIYFNTDGMLHEANGVRGSVSYAIKAGGIPVIKYTAKGLYVAPLAATLPTPTLTSWQKPVAVNTANTTFSLHGYAAILSDLSINIDTKLEHKRLVGAERIDIEDHIVTGSATFELPTIAAKDYFTISNAGTSGAFSIQHGPATNRVTLASSNVQVFVKSLPDVQGDRHVQADLVFWPTTAGNDELNVTVA